MSAHKIVKRLWFLLGLISGVAQAQTYPFTPPPLQGDWFYNALPTSNLILGTPVATRDQGTVYWNGTTWQTTPLSSITVSGSVTVGDCVEFAGITTVADAGAACGTGGGGSAAFSALTSGSNTSAAMVVGSGASLVATGTGTITATALSSLTGLPQIANNSVLANFTGGYAAPSANNALLISSGNAGGLLGFTNSTTLASSAAYAADKLLVGGSGTWCPTSVLPCSLSANGVPYLTAGVVSVAAYLPAALGGCGENVNPNNSTSNTVCGQYANANIAAGTLDNTAFGFAAGNYQQGNATTALGWTALQGTGSNVDTGSYNTGIGAGALATAQGAAGQNTALGAFACGTVTTGTFNNCIGYAVGNNGMATNQDTTLIGSTILCVPSSTSSINEFDLCGNSTYVLRITGEGIPATSQALFAGNLAAAGHLISAQTALTASNLTSCGTTPSISANATDTKGTITEGTTATGCVLSFATAFASAPDCVVSSPNGAAFTSYTAAAATLTIVNASASNNKYTYICVQ